ncbi:hypothetical protein N7540_005849 [Penicillium herquei]|nr:hypothetical protein N7540_005849 [Penicillium herquei]
MAQSYALRKLFSKSKADETLEGTYPDSRVHSWTFPPKHVARDEPAESLCVYSLQTFANGRGMSILNTLRRIESLLQRPAFMTPNILVSVNVQDFAPYEMRHLSGRGRGLIANRILNPGDRILATTPILIFDPEIDHVDVKRNGRNYKTKVSITSLSIPLSYFGTRTAS